MRPPANSQSLSRAELSLSPSLACALAVTAALTWLGTAGAEYLPSLFVDQTRETPFLQYWPVRCG